MLAIKTLVRQQSEGCLFILHRSRGRHRYSSQSRTRSRSRSSSYSRTRNSRYKVLAIKTLVRQQSEGCLFILHRSRGRHRYSSQSRTRSRSRSSSYSRTRNSRYRGRHRSHSPFSEFSDPKRDQGNRVSVVDLHTAPVQCKLLWFGLGYAIDCT